MRKRNLIAALLAAAGVGCPKAAVQKPAPPVAAAAPALTEAQLLAPKIAAISAEAKALMRAQDEAVWKHWTEGAPLELERTYSGHEALFTPARLKDIRRARELAADPREKRALGNLEIWLAGEL